MITIKTTGKCAMCPYCEIEYEREITSHLVYSLKYTVCIRNSATIWKNTSLKERKEQKMRLIDADALMVYCRNQKSKTIECNDIARFPTAYDADKVVEELNYIEMKWDKSCPPPNEYGEPMCNLDCVECQIRRCRILIQDAYIQESMLSDIEREK